MPTVIAGNSHPHAPSTHNNRSTHDIVGKLWNLCNVLKDDEVTFHQTLPNPHIRSSVAMPSNPSPSLSVSALSRQRARREARVAGSALSTGTWS